MSRIASDKKAEAEKLFRQGERLADIAAKLRVSEGTVRSWKARGKWETTTTKSSKPAKKNDKCVAVNATKNAALTKTLQKNVAKEKSVAIALQKKKGAPLGNQNAKGSKGNPHPLPPPDRTKHGAYKPVWADQLDDDEKKLLEEIDQDEEGQLIEQIKLFTIRERRIMKAIAKYIHSEEDMTDTDRMEHNGGTEGYFTETHSQNNDLIVARLEQELSTVQGKKTKSISELAKLHLEKQKLATAETGGDDELVKAWADRIRGIRKSEGGDGNA